MDKYDAVVVGGGPAGLQATLTLARVHRRVLMVDSGRYRNDPAAHMHNVVTHDGTPPAEFRAAARKELAAYDTVTVRDDAVTSVIGRSIRRAAASGSRSATSWSAPAACCWPRASPTRCRTSPGWPSCSGPWWRTARSATATSSPAGTSASSASPGAGHLPGLVGPIASRVTVFTDGAELQRRAARRASRSAPTGSPASARARSARRSASPTDRPRRWPDSSSPPR